MPNVANPLEGKITELWTAADNARSLAALVRGYFEHGEHSEMHFTADDVCAFVLVADMIYKNAHDAYNIATDISEMKLSAEAGS